MEIRNNVQSPNFGMALKIKPTAGEFLKKQSSKTLESLEKLGEEFKDYKHWDLVVDGDGYHAVGKYFLDGSYRAIETPKGYMGSYSTSFCVPVQAERFADKGKTIEKYMSYPTSDEAIGAYKTISQASCGLDRTAEFVKELEKISARQAYEKVANDTAEAAHSEKINNLMGKFGSPE